MKRNIKTNNAVGSSGSTNIGFEAHSKEGGEKGGRRAQFQ
jgi:hypothetical protein